MAKQHSEGFLKVVNEAKQKVRELTIDEVVEKRRRGEKFLFVDVREDSEWAEGHAEGAIHIGKGVIERDIEEKVPAKDTEIVLYCGGGFRSALAGEMLQRMGYTRVISMDGGMRGWREKGLPVQKPV